MASVDLTDIERDLRAFADPWSEVVVEKNSAMWERDGQYLEVKFAAPSLGGGYPDIIHDGHRYSYKEFLAGPNMSGLPSLADFIVKTHTRQAKYVDTWAHLVDDSGVEPTPQRAVELIRSRSIDNLPYLSTRVVLVRGEAGSGKTVALRELTARQAALYRQGKTKTLFFLVDAQGRALSRLEDAMAKDLQDLRARFSYAAVAPLTRHNLLIPIIDGFDELLGSGGYDEAFSSLAAFLATLEGEGSVVASARSAFFDYRNFYDNATRFSGDGRLNYEVDTLQVHAWSQHQIKEYFDIFASERGAASEEIRSALNDLQGTLDPKNQELLSKPFYAARVADLVATGGAIKGDEDLLEQLVESFIEREHRKLLDKDNKPLLSVKGHRAFLGSLAEEMWWQENRRLDVGTVQASAELVTEQFGLPPAAAQAMVEKVSSYAFLTSDATGRRSLRFEHEVFYGYFLAYRLRDFIEREPEDLRRFIARAMVEPTLVENAIRLIGSDIERCSRAIEAICAVLRPSLSELVARENAGTLIGALLRSAGACRPDMIIRHAVFQQIALGPLNAHGLTFERCDFSEADFAQVVIEQPRFINCTLRNIAVDLATTRLERMAPNTLEQVHGVLVRGEESNIQTGKVFAPDDVAAVLVQVGMEPLTSAAPPRERRPEVEARRSVLERFVHKMERRFYASHEDIARFPFAQQPSWEEVWELLLKHELLEEHYGAKSGPAIPLVRLSVPPEIIRRGEDPRDVTVPEAVRAFWKDLVNA